MRFFVRPTLTLVAAATAAGCGSSTTQSATFAERLAGEWVYESDCRCPAPPVIFIMDLAVQGASVTGSGTWTVTHPDTLALSGYIDGNTVKLDVTFPSGTTTYFRGSIVGDRLLSGTWDDPPADLRPMIFRRLE
jgi:hypothetical protein